MQSKPYRETFRKHRILFCLPPLLVAAVLGVLAFGATKKYESSASLWVDNGPLSGSALNSASGSQPSSTEDTLLTELLATKSFAVAVGDGSTLRGYVAGQGGGGNQIDNNLATAVASGASASTPGPQVLQVSFTGPTPTIAQSTLESLIAHLQRSMTHYSQTFGQASETYYRSQVSAATRAVSRATASAAAFVQNHPGVTTAKNETYAGLVAAQQSATSQLATATSGLNQAIGQAAGGGVSTTVSVIDPPSLPATPTAGKKKALLEVVGGLLAGALISLLIIVAMTPSREDRMDREMSGGWPLDDHPLAHGEQNGGLTNGKPRTARADETLGALAAAKSTKASEPAPQRVRTEPSGLSDDRLDEIKRLIYAFAAEHDEFRQVDVRTLPTASAAVAKSSVMANGFRILCEQGVIRLSRQEGNNKWFRLVQIPAQLDGQLPFPAQLDGHLPMAEAAPESSSVTGAPDKRSRVVAGRLFVRSAVGPGDVS